MCTSTWTCCEVVENATPCRLRHAVLVQRRTATTMSPLATHLKVSHSARQLCLQARRPHTCIERRTANPQARHPREHVNATRHARQQRYSQHRCSTPQGTQASNGTRSAGTRSAATGASGCSSSGASSAPAPGFRPLSARPHHPWHSSPSSTRASSLPSWLRPPRRTSR